MHLHWCPSTQPQTWQYPVSYSYILSCHDGTIDSIFHIVGSIAPTRYVQPQSLVCGRLLKAFKNLHCKQFYLISLQVPGTYSKNFPSSPFMWCLWFSMMSFKNVAHPCVFSVACIDTWSSHPDLALALHYTNCCKLTQNFQSCSYLCRCGKTSTDVVQWCSTENFISYSTKCSIAIQVKCTFGGG